MDIRKISVGPDYKSGAMHYIVGQDILGSSHKIHLIQRDKETLSLKVWIIKSDVIVLWKEFNPYIPISIEYNINF
jgi:hypothetical protein